MEYENGGILLPEETEDKRIYRLSVWWVEHRAGIKRLGYGLFVAFDVLLLLIAGWMFLDAYAISYDAERNAVLQMVTLGQEDLVAYTQANKARELSSTEARVISIGSGRYDVYTTLSNKNDDWWAEFSYAFEYGGTRTTSKSGFILPGEDKLLVELAIASSSPVSGVRVIVEDVRWYRIDHHLIADYGVWSTDRLMLTVSDAQFIQESSFEGETFGRSTFTVKNDTAFSYYDVGLMIVLKRGNAIVGVNRTQLSSFVSGEEVAVNVNWFGTLPNVSQVEVVPELNIFDVSVYKALAGETTRDTRTRVFR